MAINNSLTLGGTMSVEVSGGTPNSDKVVGLTSVTYGGALVVSNVGPGAVAGGDTFQLFNIGGSGNFTSITPALTGGLSWSFNPATGVLSVTGGRPKLNIVNNGDGTLTFSWVNNGTDTFRLQAQTNSISVGITPNWFDYPGGGSSPVTTAINPSNPTVFYRLISN
jgi:hypothetical protein